MKDVKITRCNLRVEENTDRLKQEERWMGRRDKRACLVGFLSVQLTVQSCGNTVEML